MSGICFPKKKEEGRRNKTGQEPVAIKTERWIHEESL